MAAKPVLLTFDIFGTVLDWRTGLTASLAKRGFAIADQFDAIIDRQGVLEQERFDSYAAITARSLVDILGIPEAIALEIGRDVGRWPLYPDAPAAFQRLLQRVPCAAMTNSDRSHGEDVQRSLGSRLTHWLCAEEVGAYKPHDRFWQAARERFGVAYGPSWWHVSAYADYDLDVVPRFGLTPVFIRRPHQRPSKRAGTSAELAFDDLGSLASEVERIL